jgi:alpha-D-xyloside xylohydrolase
MYERNWKRAITLAVMLGGCLLQSAISAASIPVTSVTKDAQGVSLAMTPGAMRIDVCTDGIIRIRYCQQSTIPVDPNMSFLVVKQWTPVTFTQDETATDVTIKTTKVQVKVNKSTGAVTFLDASGTTLLQEPSTGGKSLTPATINSESTLQCEQAFDSPADEGIYGLGSSADGIINYHGIPQYLHQENTNIGIPVILSSKGYGILWANASRTYFNLPDQQINLSNGNGQFTTTTAGDYVFLTVGGPVSGNTPLTVNGTVINRLDCRWHSSTVTGKIRLDANKTVSVSASGTLYGGPLHNSTKFTSRSGQTIDYYFFYGPSGDEVIANYRLATGAAPLFNKGLYGFVQCKAQYNNQADILNAGYQFRNRKVPVDVIVQDWNYWTNGWGSMEFDPARYPNTKQMVDSLHKLNLSCMLSVWSNPQGGAVNTALSSLKMPGTPFYDAFNPNARSVYWSYMNTKLFSSGFDAFWQDADEPEGYNLETSKVNFGSGAVGGKQYLNAYPLFVCKTVYEGWRSVTTAKRVCILSRSSFAGNQRFGSMVWNGDIGGNDGGALLSQNWDWLQRSIPEGLNFCMTGLPYWTTDIGAFFRTGGGQYTDAGYNELLTRWIEYGAFCPIFRIHGYGCNTEIWNYTTSTQNAFMTYDNLRHRLLPYIYTLASQITNNGSTMMRGLAMDFRNDAAVLDIKDQFMFGPAFMVSPVASAGATSRSVYLPAGKWYDFWTGTAVDGGAKITADAPLNKIPLHIRAGSIIPMGPQLQYWNQKPTDTIEVRIYPGANGSFTLYEDEGDSYNYETGKCATIPITYIDNPRNVILGTRQGSFDGMDTKKVFNIVYVSSNKGTGEAITATPDAQLIYTGAQTSITGVFPSRLSKSTLLPGDFTKKTARNLIALPVNFSGKTKNIMVYDCSGKLLRNAAFKKNSVDLRKDFGLPTGVYIIKVKMNTKVSR